MLTEQKITKEVVQHEGSYLLMSKAIRANKTYIQYVAEVKPTGKFVYNQKQWDLTRAALIGE